MFVFEVDLFSHTSKGHIFTALPRFEAFLTQERGFPAFLKSRKSINFYRFLVFFTRFSYSATPQSQHMSATYEEHVYQYRVGYGRNMSTGCVFRQVYWKLKTTFLVSGNRWVQQPLFDFPTVGFSTSDTADGLDLIHVPLDSSWRYAKTLQNLLPRDSFFVLYEFLSSSSPKEG